MGPPKLPDKGFIALDVTQVLLKVRRDGGC